MKQNYELSYLISSQASEGACQEISGKINDFIQTKEGVVLESQLPQRISLAYPIRKEGACWLQITYFSLDTSNLGDLQKKLKEEKGILRFLLLVKRPVKISARRARKSKEATSKFVSKEISKLVSKEISKLDSDKLKKEVGTSQQKVELKEIEKKLEEILNKEDELK